MRYSNFISLRLHMGYDILEEENYVGNVFLKRGILLWIRRYVIWSIMSIHI